MTLGMSTSTLTLVHVLISLVGIGSGLVVMYGLLTANRLDRWTMLFLVTTVLTNVSGFVFPDDHITPGIMLGITSMVVLAVAVVARYGLRLAGAWRSIYVITAILALYFNVFVVVDQFFEKVPLGTLVPPIRGAPANFGQVLELLRLRPIGITQAVVVILFLTATVFGVKRFRPESGGAESPAEPHKSAA